MEKLNENTEERETTEMGDGVKVHILKSKPHAFYLTVVHAHKIPL